MFAGHIGAALALKKASPGVRLGWLFLAALLPDFLLGLFVLAGWESVRVPGDFRERHYLTFDFPYSHGLLATAGWAGVAAWTWRLTRRGGTANARGSRVVFGAVLSHWLLDWLAHVPDLPLAGRDSALVGLGLWQQLGFALSLEAGIVAAGLWLCLPAMPTGRVRRPALFGLALSVTLLTVIGQAFATAAPQPRDAAITWIVCPLLLAGLGAWLDRGTTLQPRTRLPMISSDPL
jgi:hypothetical protein